MRNLIRKLISSQMFFYGIAVSGQIVQSIFHFCLSLLLIKFVSATEFGVYALIFILLYLILGICNALVNTPLSSCLSQIDDKTEKSSIIITFAKVNLYISIISGLCVGGFMMLWLGQLWVAINTSILTAAFIWRHFARGINYADRNYRGVNNCDFLYVAIGTIMLLFVLWDNSENLSLLINLIILNIACLSSLFYAGFSFVKLQFWDFYAGKLNNYSTIWKDTSSWNLIGVVTTEISTNSHSYIISMLAGPQAFAPIAAAAIIFRPFNILVTSLMSLELPLLTKQFLLNNKAGIVRTCSLFLIALLTCLLLLTLSIWGFWSFIFDELYADKYDHYTVILAVLLWGGIFFITAFKCLLIILMQAQNRFRQLAMITLFTAPIGIFLVATLFILYNPIISLIGILITDIIILSLISYELWRKKNI